MKKKPRKIVENGKKKQSHQQDKWLIIDTNKQTIVVGKLFMLRQHITYNIIHTTYLPFPPPPSET